MTELLLFISFSMNGMKLILQMNRSFYILTFHLLVFLSNNLSEYSENSIVDIILKKFPFHNNDLQNDF